MKKIFSMLVATLLLFSMEASAQCSCSANNGGMKREPVKMILDADFGSSTDDLFALMMLNHYIDEGLVDLQGIVVDREGENNAGVVDIFNTYYGHPYIPVAPFRRDYTQGLQSAESFSILPSISWRNNVHAPALLAARNDTDQERHFLGEDGAQGKPASEHG